MFRSSRLLINSFLISLMAVFLVLFALDAKPEKGKGKRSSKRDDSHMHERLAEKLELTDKQKNQLKALVEKHFNAKDREEHRKKMQEMQKKEKNSDDVNKKREEMRKAMKVKRDAFHADLKKILTSDQKKKFEEMPKNRQDREKDQDKKK